MTAVLSRKFMRTPAKRNVCRNCPARLAPVGNEATHVQLRQSKLQPLQTLVHQQWEVCWSQKLLTAVLFRKFMRTAAKGEAYSNRPAWLVPLGNRKTRNWARCTLLLQPVKTLFHCQREVDKSQKSLTTMLFYIFPQTTTVEKTYSSCPAWLAPLGNRKTRNWARCTLLLQPVKILFH